MANHWIDRIDWTPIESPLEGCALNSENDGVPYATHTGVIHVGGIQLDCVQLNTGQRLITEESMNRLLGQP